MNSNCNLTMQLHPIWHKFWAVVLPDPSREWKGLKLVHCMPYWKYREPARNDGSGTPQRRGNATPWKSNCVETAIFLSATKNGNNSVCTCPCFCIVHKNFDGCTISRVYKPLDEARAGYFRLICCVGYDRSSTIIAVQLPRVLVCLVCLPVFFFVTMPAQARLSSI